MMMIFGPFYFVVSRLSISGNINFYTLYLYAFQIYHNKTFTPSHIIINEGFLEQFFAGHEVLSAITLDSK